MTLSKSDYMLFLRHPAWLWLKKFQKNKLPPIDANTQAVFDEGHEFENYAEKLFPNAVKLGFNNYNEYLVLFQKTKAVLNQGVQTIFQGGFETDGIACIVDVLDRVNGNTFDLIEIKSSTKAKPEHEYDLAFQVIVLEQSGLKIRNVEVIHANKEYVRNGEIEPNKLTSKTDITEKVRSLIPLTKNQINAAFAVLSQRSMPDLSPRYVNQVGIPDSQWFTEWLDIYKYLHSDLDPYSIYYLSYPSPEQIGELEDQGIKFIKDILETLALRPKQLAQIQTTRDDKRIIDKEKIGKFLTTFEYPLYFLDYETFSSVVPVFDGCRPYADYPFQYSLYVLNAPGEELKHAEYLHQANSNPMPGLISQLKQDIGNKGTILAWNMSYEKGCNDRMAEFYPEHKEFFEGVNKRINDLMIPFANMWFFDKKMFGSASVKKVLPTLIPELTYKDLDIHDGLFARRIWTQTVLKGENQPQKEKIMSDLSQYCTLDTYAMVKILEKLQTIIKN